MKKQFKDKNLLEGYVSKIDDVCGDGKEFIVTLNYDKKEESFEKILKKCHVKQRLSGILIKAEYGDKDVSIFKTGKLLISGFDGVEEAEKFLEELLK